MSIRITHPDWCVASGSIESLRKCKTFKARLVGHGIDAVKRFAMLDLDGEPLIADCITGTIYDADGKHVSSSLRVTEFPLIRARDIPLWLGGSEAKRESA